MDISFSWLNNSFFSTYIVPILTTFVGTIFGGIITLVVNSYHERNKLIMSQKLKIWEIISEYFQEIYEDCKEIEDEYFNIIIDKNKIISLFNSNNIKISKNIRKIETRLRNYYMLFENGNYLSDLKKKLVNIEVNIEINGDSSNLNELHDEFVEFQIEFSNVHKKLNLELVKMLDNKKTKRKRVNNFNKQIGKNFINRIFRAFTEK